MATQHVELAITMIADDKGHLGIDFSGVRIITADDGTEASETLPMHETIGLALRAISNWHISEHQKTAPKGPQLLLAGGYPVDLRSN